MRYFYLYISNGRYMVYDTDEGNPLFERLDEKYCEKWCDRMNAQVENEHKEATNG